MTVEAMKQALDALENGKRVRACEGGTAYQPDLEDNAIKSLRQAIEQAEKQKPVGWWNGRETAWFEHETDRRVDDCTIPLYTAPPQREWVGLTDEEWLYIWDEAGTDMWIQNGREDAERMINAKLKEKKSCILAD